MKKKKIKKALPKYLFGGGTNDHLEGYLDIKRKRLGETPGIENPNTALAENEIARARALEEAQGNALTTGLDIFGNLAMQVGSSMMSSGMAKGQGVSKGGFNWGNLLQQGIGALGTYGNATQPYANGGVVDPPGNKQKKFIKDWFGSDITRERLSENLRSYPKAQSAINRGLRNVEETTYKEHPDVDLKDTKAAYKNKKIDVYKGASPEDIVHEYTHAMGDVDKSVGEYILGEYGTPLTALRRKLGMADTEPLEEGVARQFGIDTSNRFGRDEVRQIIDHTRKRVGTPDEIYPRFMEMRHYLKVKPGDEIKDSHIKKLQGNKDTQELFNYYSPEEIKDILNTVAYNEDNLNDTTMAAYGGKMKKMAGGGKVNVEVEGQEIIETPDGAMAELSGPSHEQGGIAMFLPEGTEVFSKRIKGPDGKTMADRKKKRERKIKKLEKLFEKDPSDVVLKKTLSDTKANYERQEQDDLAQMEFARNLFNGVMAYGGRKMAQGGILNIDPEEPLTKEELKWLAIQHRGDYPADRVPSRYISGRKAGNPIFKSLTDSQRSQLKEYMSETNFFTDLIQGLTPDTDIFNPKPKDSKLAYGGKIGKKKYASEGKMQYGTRVNNNIFQTGGVTRRNPNINYGVIDEFFGSMPMGDDASTYGASTPGFNPAATTEQADTRGNFLSGLLGDGQGSGGLTIGDMIGLAGDYTSTFGPMRNTLANRAGDQPNVNYFEDFGQDALDTIDETKGYVAGQRDKALSDIELSRSAAMKRGRSSARGINTLRAMDLATTLGTQRAEADVYDNFARMMQSILGQEAQTELQRDQAVMSGERERDLADRMDRDAFYSQLAKDISTKGTGLQKIGRDVNQIKTRNVTGNVLNQMYDNFQIDVMSGNIKTVAESELATNAGRYTGMDKAQFDKVIKGLSSGEYEWKGDVLYDKSGNIVDINTK